MTTIGKALQDAMNEQINKEFFSSYLYLSMAAYFEDKNLTGFAHWMRLQADVGVGTALSGGLDSSSSVYVINQLLKQDLAPSVGEKQFCFSSVFSKPDETWADESRYINLVTGTFNVRSVKVTPTPERLIRELAAMVYHQDEPFGSASIIMQWFVFERAKAEGMTVMLDGQGADETLAGYHTYFATIALHLLAQRKILSYLSLRSDFEKEIGKFPLPAAALPIGIFYPAIPSWIKKKMRTIARKFRGMTSANAIDSVLNPGAVDTYKATAKDVFAIRSLNEELQIQVRSTVLPALLRYEDRNSMAHSIEARVPFLDYRLVDFLFTLPERWKIHGVTTKYILREAMKGILPETIRTRKDKVGFKATPDLTFRYVRKNSDALSENRNEFENRWFDSNRVKEMLSRQESSDQFEFLLWRILNLKLWARQHWS